MPDKKISTSNLLQRLFKTTNIKSFIKRYDKQIAYMPFNAYLANLCEMRDTVPERVIKKSGIERTYGHQLFSGRRKPSRDKVIQLAFGFDMDYDEIQEFLKTARKSLLYPKIKRDAVIIYALKRKLSIDSVQATLLELELPVLGREDRYE